MASGAPQLTPKIKVIPYPSPQSAAGGEPPPISSRDKTILFVGRVHPEKGVHVLIDAFANGADSADWKLVIIGPMENRHGGGGSHYFQQLRRHAATSVMRVELRGPVFEAESLAREFRKARLFVYPSLA